MFVFSHLLPCYTEDHIPPKPPRANPTRFGGLIATALLLVTLFSTVLVTSIIIIRKRQRNQRCYHKDLTTGTINETCESLHDHPRVTTAETAVVPSVDYTVVKPLFSSSNLYGSMTMNKFETSTSVTIEVKLKAKNKPTQ